MGFRRENLSPEDQEGRNLTIDHKEGQDLTREPKEDLLGSDPIQGHQGPMGGLTLKPLVCTGLHPSTHLQLVSHTRGPSLPATFTEVFNQTSVKAFLMAPPLETFPLGNLKEVSPQATSKESFLSTMLLISLQVIHTISLPAFLKASSLPTFHKVLGP